MLRARSWRWLQVRILGLISKAPAIVTDNGTVIASTRLGLALNPPGKK